MIGPIKEAGARSEVLAILLPDVVTDERAISAEVSLAARNFDPETLVTRIPWRPAEMRA